jgi:peptidylprolyl isomerase
MFRSLFFICVASTAFSVEPPAKPDTSEITKISEAMGHLIGKNLQALGFSVDLNAVVKGMQNAAEGKTPALSEEECVQAIAALQEESLSVVSDKNLEEANTFLQKNGENEDIVSLEEGKLQYKIEKAGEGQSVQPYNSPVLQYKAKYLDGSVFGASEGAELVSLEDTIPGFSKGIVGMQEGEERTLYVHPDLGYGKQGQLNPNALLIFEITVVKADASADAQAASNAPELPQLVDPEQNSPETDSQKVR